MKLSVLVEIPKGSRNKYEYDKERKVINFDRMLFSSVHYPSDYGFIEDTIGEDGDALDALVLVWEPTFPGCHILVKPIAALDMSDDKGNDHKILCGPGPRLFADEFARPWLVDSRANPEVRTGDN